MKWNLAPLSRSHTLWNPPEDVDRSRTNSVFVVGMWSELGRLWPACLLCWVRTGSRVLLYLQVHSGDVRPDGLWELPAGLHVFHGSQKQAPDHQVAPPVLRLYRQEVRRVHLPGQSCGVELCVCVQHQQKLNKKRSVFPWHVFWSAGWRRTWRGCWWFIQPGTSKLSSHWSNPLSGVQHTLTQYYLFIQVTLATTEYKSNWEPWQRFLRNELGLFRQ